MKINDPTAVQRKIYTRYINVNMHQITFQINSRPEAFPGLTGIKAAARFVITSKSVFIKSSQISIFTPKLFLSFLELMSFL